MLGNRRGGGGGGVGNESNHVLKYLIYHFVLGMTILLI